MSMKKSSDTIGNRTCILPVWRYRARGGHGPFWNAIFKFITKGREWTTQLSDLTDTLQTVTFQLVAGKIYCMLSSGWFTGISSLNANISERCLFHLHSYLLMKMKQAECSERLAFKLQMLGNHPEGSIQHSVCGKSLKSRMVKCTSLYLNTGVHNGDHIQDMEQSWTDTLKHMQRIFSQIVN
jgi:hypothetical protein